MFVTFKNRYTPPVNVPWQGRPDLPANACLFQVMRLLNLTNSIDIKHPSFAFIGFCCDEGIRRNHGRTGAATGSANIRHALSKLPVPRTNVHYYDAGDITCVDGDLEAAQQALATAVSILLKNKIVPIVLGGGHELAWGHYQGIANYYPSENLGIVNFDAHFDMRPLLPEEKGSSGTPFLQIANAHNINKRRFDYNCIGIQETGNMQLLFDTAQHYHTHMITADDIHHTDVLSHRGFINRIINDNQIIYLSLCLDVFAAPFAPGVSAPQSMGILPWSIIPFIKQLAASGKVISYDIAELSPPYDQDNRTAKLAASFIFEIISHHTFN